MVPEDEEGEQVAAESARKFADGNLAKEVVDEKVQVTRRTRVP